MFGRYRNRRWCCRRRTSIDACREARDLAHVTSRRGSPKSCRSSPVTHARRPAFIGMHWGEEYVSGRGREGDATYGVNALTLQVLNPSSKQPTKQRRSRY